MRILNPMVLLMGLLGLLTNLGGIALLFSYLQSHSVPTLVGSMFCLFVGEVFILLAVKAAR